MKSTVMKAMFATVLAVGVAMAQAEDEYDYGGGGESKQGREDVGRGKLGGEGGGLNADNKEGEKGDGPELKAKATTVEEALSNYAQKHDWNLGAYDEGKKRIIVQEVRKMDLDFNPSVDEKKFLDLRTELASELLLVAKGEVISTLYTTMSAERLLSIPGNPLRSKVSREEELFRKQMAETQRQLKRLGEKVDAAEKDVGTLNASEVMASISAWFANAEKKNLAAKYDADKKELYRNAKADFVAAEKRYSEMMSKAETLKGQITKSFKSSMTRKSEFQLHGGTVLHQVEKVFEKNGKYRFEIGLLYSWSEERALAAQAILSGKEMRFKPGKYSLREWLDNKKTKNSLALLLGPRTYIDKDGNMWYMGFSAACASEVSDVEEENQRIALEEARAEVGYALFAEACVKNVLTKEMVARDAKGVGHETERRVSKILHNETREKFDNLGLSGLGNVLPMTKVKNPRTGIEFWVCGFGINASSSANVREIKKRMEALAREMNVAVATQNEAERMIRDWIAAGKTDPRVRRDAEKYVRDVIEKYPPSGNGSVPPPKAGPQGGVGAKPEDPPAPDRPDPELYEEDDDEEEEG